MSAPQRDTTIESALPVVSSNGLNTNQNINFNSGSNSCDLPAATTLNGSAISAQGNVTGSGTTGATFSVTNTGVYTGVGAFQVIGDSATTGVVSLITGNGLTTGTVLSLSSTGTIVTTGAVLKVTANSATTSTGLVQISGTALTSGVGLLVTGGGSVMTSAGIVASFTGGANTDGSVLKVLSTGAYSGTVGVFALTTSATTGSVFVHTSNSLTSGIGKVLSVTGLTTGIGIKVIATAATLTTGRYFSANDTTNGEVFGVGLNGHLISTVGTTPTIATNSTGISACAITSGGSDTCGQFTTTGTPASGTVLTITFGKTYTTAPKFVGLSPLNAAAGNPNTVPYISSITATTAVITWPAGGTYAATPSYAYFVIA